MDFFKNKSLVIKTEHIQEIMLLLRSKTESHHTEEFWVKVANCLWDHLEKCLENLDDQLLCATCFYSVLLFTNKKEQDIYMDKLLQVFSSTPNSPSRYIQTSLPSSKRLPFGAEEFLDIIPSNANEIKQQKSTLRVISLIYGMFQSSFLTRTTDDNTSKLSLILKATFNLLLPMGYEYSEYTFLTFKIITMYKKICGGSLYKSTFNEEYQLRLLALVNNNWENPVTGVRDLNRSIFKTIITTMNNDTFKKVSKEIGHLYWNKAKFLMLSDIIDNHNGTIASLMQPMWIDGLINSLYKPGLVSAGADMYYAVLKRINTIDDWCKFFLLPIVNILSNSCTKPIDNFCNYWCLPTFKKFRALPLVLIDKLDNDSKHVLYSTLSILKQANKFGIADKTSKSACHLSMLSAVPAGIDIYNTHTRMLAFEIICVSHGKIIPTQSEYNLILNYLSHNLISDSTVLRISMLSSVNYFLLNLQSLIKNIVDKPEASEDFNNLLSFCTNIQYLIRDNIDVSGNYQRKITSVKLCNCIITCCTTISKKKKADVPLIQENITLMDFLKQKNCWLLSTEEFVKKLVNLLKDPSDDVRENVIKILLSHYINELQCNIIQEIANEATKYVQSKFFYEISCGLSMFKLITNILLRTTEDIQSEYKSVEGIFEFAFNVLITQHAAKTNLMNSIQTGQQLHSYISILIIILEESNTNFYNLTSLDSSKMSRLLDVLEDISNQFVWEEGSSDFAEMSDLIQNIIDTSDYNSLCEDDDSKISGLQQIVLNCLWLNVKASCDLATTLVQNNVNDVTMCEKCLNLIARVLETSRHKGAIEAAGAALGKGIHYLTSLSHKKTNSSDYSAEVSRLPFKLLKTKLNELISETSKMSSITRRGAGLSIMLHRIVSNDMIKGKPLFHYFIKELLQKCKIHQNDITDESIENQVDLPAAIYIHFMTKIVTDSSLATDVMYYSTELAELAFGNLTSSHWQIRNAALQLYGALTPRLIGQKKASGTDDETIATVACDEMLTHSPKLWRYMTEQLKQNNEDVLQTHSNLVPILNLLASCAKRYYFTSPTMPHDSEINDLFNHLIPILCSPIYTVRRLTAQVIFNMYDFELINSWLLKQENVTENLLHGMLILLRLCVSYYSGYNNFEASFITLREKFNVIFREKLHSYPCRQLYEYIFGDKIHMDDIKNTIIELNDSRSPGVYAWAEARLQKYVKNCLWNDIPGLLDLSLPLSKAGNYHQTVLEYILQKMDSETILPNDVLLKIANTLIATESMNCSSIVWQILYQISRKADIHCCIDAAHLLIDFKGELYNRRYMIPLIARYIEYASEESKEILLSTIHRMSDFEISDVDMRYIAAVANNELSHNFHRLPDILKVISIKCAVFLLQDEDEDVRNISVNFYCVIVKEKRQLQPYICLKKILEPSFLNSVFEKPEKGVEELKIKMNALLNVSHKVDEYNPFANDTKNIYIEPFVLKNLVNRLNI